MLAYALRRLLRSIPLLLGLSLVVFALIHAAPGGPLSVYLENPHVRPEDVERLKRSLGLDRPLHEQYLRWLAAFVQGDWGYSYVDGRRALTRVMERVPATLELMAVAISLALFFASALALVGSMHRGRAADRATLLVSLGGISVPTFWLGLMLQLVFAVGLGWFPSAGRQSPLRTDLLDRASHLVLPAVTLAVFYAASWTRYLRGSLVEAMEEPYLRAGEARGLSGWRMVLRHALPNALIPFVTVLAIDLALVFSGAVVTETVFAWPGMGSLLVESVHRRDYTVLMGLVMAGAALVLASSLATDILYGVLDPRVRVGGGGAGGQRVRS